MLLAWACVGVSDTLPPDTDSGVAEADGLVSVAWVSGRGFEPSPTVA